MNMPSTSRAITATPRPITEVLMVVLLTITVGRRLGLDRSMAAIRHRGPREGHNESRGLTTSNQRRADGDEA